MTCFRRITSWSALTLSLCASLAYSAPPSLPQRNLVIDWRQIDDHETSSQPAARWSSTVTTSGAPSSVSGGVTVSTQQRSSSQAFSQQMRVLNGGRVTVRLNQSIPVMWVEAAQTTANTVGGYGGANTPRTSGAAVVQGLTWLDAGRQISLQPRWPGGELPAVVDIQVDNATLENERPTVAAMNSGGAALPVQTRSQTVTTVLAPLGQWVTIARTGGETTSEQRGVVSTMSATSQQRQLMQIRVLVP
ncbi:MAG: hypothetical protein RIS44_6 [Pseudomonadota bacterium]|jgi:hypothetical protein